MSLDAQDLMHIRELVESVVEEKVEEKLARFGAELRSDFRTRITAVQDAIISFHNFFISAEYTSMSEEISTNSFRSM